MFLFSIVFFCFCFPMYSFVLCFPMDSFVLCSHWILLCFCFRVLFSFSTDIMDMSKLRAGELELPNEPFALRPLVEEVAAAAESPRACRGGVVGLAFKGT